MPNQWFRMYSEFEDDPKVQMLSEPMQRRLVMLFCERCKEIKLTDAQRAFKWRISAQEVAETKAAFVEAGFINDAWELENWNKRQFLSDSSTDRVRKYREGLKQDETLHETVETKQAVTVTPPDTDTEQIQSRKEHTASQFVVPLWIHEQTWKDFEEMRKKIRKPLTDRARQNIVTELGKMQIRGHDPEAVLNQSITNSWSGVFELKGGASGARASQTKSDAVGEAVRATIAGIRSEYAGRAGGSAAGGSGRERPEAVRPPPIVLRPRDGQGGSSPDSPEAA